MSAAMASEITPKLSIGFEAYTLGDRSSALVGIGSKYLQFNLTYDFFCPPLFFCPAFPLFRPIFHLLLFFLCFFSFFPSFLSPSQKSRSGPLGSAFFDGIVSKLLLAVSVKPTVFSHVLLRLGTPRDTHTAMRHGTRKVRHQQPLVHIENALENTDSSTPWERRTPLQTTLDSALQATTRSAIILYSVCLTCYLLFMQ